MTTPNPSATRRPKIKARWRHMAGAFVVRRMDPKTREMLYDASPACKHEWVLVKWSGVECNDCDGWFCY